MVVRPGHSAVGRGLLFCSLRENTVGVGGVQYTDAPDSSAQSNTLPNDELVSLGAAICRALDDIPEDDDLSVSIVKAVFPVVEVNGHTSISAFSGLEGRELAWKFVKFLESGGCRA